MTALSLLAALAAFALFALSTDSHALARLGSRPTAIARNSRRTVAWMLLLAAFALAVVARGWVFGPVLWSGLVMVAAGAVFLALNLLPSHRPRERARSVRRAPRWS